MSCIASLDGFILPWNQGERSRPQRRLYYEVVIGSIAMDKASAALTRSFGEDEELVRKQGRAAIATVLLDKSGVPLADGGVAISSFAWALPKALEGAFSSLGSWVKAEETLVAKL